MIYFGIFSSIMTYSVQIWGQIESINVNRISKLQDKAIRIINFANFWNSRNPLYFKSKILKLSDRIKLQNFLYVYDSLKGNLPSVLNNNYRYIHNIHDYNTRINL